MYIPPLIAIDMGSYAIRVLEVRVSPQREKSKVIRLASKRLPEGIIQGGQIQVPDVAVRVLKDLLQQMRVRWVALRRAAILLGPEACIIKNTEIEVADGQDLEELVFAGAEQELQTDINDLYFDFYERATAFETTKKSVVLVAARKEIVDQRISILQQLNLKPGIVECSAFSLVNTAESLLEASGRAQAIINVGKTTSEIIFIVNHQYYYSRAIGVGGDHFSLALAEATGKTFGECEAMKVRFSTENRAFDEKMLVALASVYGVFAGEIQQTSEMFFQSKLAPIDTQDLEKIWVCGGGAKITDFCGQLKSHLKIPVEELNPFARMGWKTHAAMGNEYSLSYGLCLREYIAS
jgi:type IV pilus assembly protein PilM